jgi:bifunctional DNA-binding transcriptional regulator/antitoxin component of YhaV-PrlF toxin-antitoxin module
MGAVRKYRIRKAAKHEVYEITVPKSWLNFYNLKPGDEVYVFTNSVLVVAPNEKLAEKARKILSELEA